MTRYRLKINPDGTSETVPFTAEEEAARDAEETASALEDRRTVVISDIKAEGMSRINALFPELEDMEELATIFRALAPTARSTNLDTAKGVRDYAVAQVVWTKNPSRTQAELDAYDAATDPGWP